MSSPDAELLHGILNAGQKFIPIAGVDVMEELLKEDQLNVSRSLKALMEGHFNEQQKQIVYELLKRFAQEYRILSLRDQVQADQSQREWARQFAAQTFQKKMNQILQIQIEKKAELSNRLSCSVGCVECCKQPVTVSNDEAELLLQEASVRGVEISQERLNKQNSVARNEWYKLNKEDRACVFLGSEGKCQVYDIRPLYCRKHLSLDDPQKCDKASDEIPEMFIAPEAEILASAVVSAAGGGLMSELLAERTQLKQSYRESLVAEKVPKLQK